MPTQTASADVHSEGSFEIQSGDGQCPFKGKFQNTTGRLLILIQIKVSKHDQAMAGTYSKGSLNTQLDDCLCPIKRKSKTEGLPENRFPAGLLRHERQRNFVFHLFKAE
ncbi:hypothetical protein UZ35_04690 [Heyndrickxia coagulans]|uniref:Uncharacterized protein n=1 Tax=Heyndrickxia coagulans TaxID=1398 RepID=A0A133KE36_HEYCO|nr:hypothetical protein BIZ35_00115 [Heyndrickxia coagulans]KGT38275.1 hypothetical protein P421_11020 [Heyndrickxia coagulans P38]ATW84048.1 hypothetical protein CIW84_14215 [Heyndrickxia coagulans]KGB30653.1 hypothetical protein IE89_03695 [Heyndrickxia coagulans]KWZ77841.1 hypothetical protein HMPREF3213_03193 [Heyndrickxia coagulans]